MFRVDEGENGGFARAGMAGQERKLTLADVKRDIAQGKVPLGVSLENLRELDHSSCTRVARSPRRERLVEIINDILNVLETDADPDEPVWNAKRLPFFCR